MAQAVWNGFLRLSLVSCPIHLSPARKEDDGLQLDQLNPRTGNPVTQQYLDARTGDVVALETLVKGYLVHGSHYVSLSEQELTTLSGQPSDIVDITQFVPRDQVDRALLEGGYYIYPEGQLASDTLHAVRVAMQRSARLGIGAIHLAGRTRSVVIEPQGAGLVMSTVRRVPEVIPPEFGERAENEIPAEMVEIAETIIARRAADFDADALRDRYEERLRALIHQKAGGGSFAGLMPAATQAAPETTAASEPEPEPSPPAGTEAPPYEPPPYEPPPISEQTAAHEEPEPEPAPQPMPEGGSRTARG